MILMSATHSLIQHFNKQPKYDQVIIINGHNLKDSVEEQNKFFLKHFTNVQILGDGKTHITLEEIESFFESLNTAPKIISDNALLVIHHHGNVHQFKGHSHQSHIIANRDKESYHIARVFQLITKPIDIILSSCHSGAAINDIDKLPSGSRLLTLSDESHSLFGAIYTAAFKISKNQQFSLKSFYYSTLLASHSYEFLSYPLLAVSGENNHINFIQDDTSKIKNITQEQKTFLASKLYGYICPDVPQVLCQKTIFEYAKTIENIHNISDINQNFISKEHLDTVNAIDIDKKNPTADTQRDFEQIAKILEYYSKLS